MAPQLNQNARYAYDRLKKVHNFNDVQASGIVGNLMAESSFNLNARNAGDGRDGSDSIGIAQWNGDRAKGLNRFATDRGSNASDLDTQIDYYVHELNNGEKRAGDMIRSAKDITGATIGGIAFERPAGFSWDNPTAGHNFDLRNQYARQAYQDFSGSDPSAVAGSAPTQQAASSQQPDNELIPGLKDGMGKVASAMGFSGSGSDGDPKKFLGINLEGDDGLLSDLAGISSMFQSSEGGPQIVPTGRGQSEPIKVAFDVGSPSISQPTEFIEEDPRKRRGGLAGFGGFSRKA